MYPPGFTIHTGTCFITVYQSASGHFQPDFFVGSLQGIRTARYHVFDRTGCKRDVEHAGKDFVCAVDADSPHRIKSHNHCLKIFTILHSGLYISRKMTGSGASMQRTFRYREQIMCGHIHCDHGIYFMPCLFDTGFFQTRVMVWTSLAVGMHVILCMIRIGDDRKTDAFMPFLCTLFFPGCFAETAVLFYCRLPQPVR